MGKGKLHVIATPIGNLKDITYRAVEVLSSADIIAAEDTRNLKKLLSALSIKPFGKIVSYHEHNESKASEKLLKELLNGKSVALVSDAGTPCISDPGFRLVRLARQSGISVTPVPGPSALTAALSASGFATDRFSFFGFLPKKEAALKKTLREISGIQHTVVAFESPHRIRRTLKMISQIMPERNLCLCRELTKMHEEFLFGKAKELIERLKEKGEFVVIFDKHREKKQDEADVRQILQELKERGFSLKSAVEAARGQTGLPKRQIYKLALAVFGKEGSQETS